MARKDSPAEAFESRAAEAPRGAVSELDMLVHRMLEESGFNIDDPVEREGDEREVVVSFLAAREIKRAIDADSDEISPGDIALAINNYREVYEYLITNRASADADFGTHEV